LGHTVRLWDIRKTYVHTSCRTLGHLYRSWYRHSVEIDEIRKWRLIVDTMGTYLFLRGDASNNVWVTHVEMCGSLMLKRMGHTCRNAWVTHVVMFVQAY